MNPYDECVLTRDQLREYDGFNDMTDDELDKALSLMYIISSVYMNNQIKIEEYERNKLKQI